MSIPAMFGVQVETRPAVDFAAACDACGNPDARWRQAYCPEGVKPAHFTVSCPTCDPIVAAVRMLRTGKPPQTVVDYLTQEAAA